ncbi:MAG: HEAT repeat domain-containing protein [Fuerstiella sp.]
MRLKKSAYALLLGGSLSVLNIGCAAVDALVSSPAGHSAGTNSPQRVAAIGRIFENQGRYTQARAMYRQALRSDPSNTTARDRLQYLASTQPAANRHSAAPEAIAVADLVAPREKLIPQTLSRQTASDVAVLKPEPEQSPIQMVRAFEPKDAVESAALSIGGQLEQVDIDLPFTPIEVTKSDLVSDAKAVDAGDSAGIASFDTTIEEEGGHWADSVSEESVTEDIAVVSRQQAFDNADNSGIALIEVDEGDSADTVATVSFNDQPQSSDGGFWRPARNKVSLSEVLDWSDTPGLHSAELIAAINQGEDQGVQALSVALLGEIQQPDAATITALKQAAMAETPLVRASALDALVLQGESNSESLDGLLSLLAGDDAKIRTQAAATLLRMADTEWCNDAINGLHRLLQDQDDEVVAVAATSLSEFGVAAVPCRDRLTEIAATTSSEMVLEAASMALSRIPRSEQ